MLLSESIVDKLTTGGITAGLGIGVTFLVLAVLIVIVLGVTKIEKVDFKALFQKIFSKKKTSDSADASVSDEKETSGASDDKKLIAAITAAVSVVLEAEAGEDAPKASFKVKSIKRI